MSLNEWVFIVAGIAGVLVLSLMGSLHWRRRSGSSAQNKAGDSTHEPAVPAHELRVFLKQDGVDLLVGRLEAAGATTMSVTPESAVRHIGVRKPKNVGDWARVDLTCTTDEVPFFTGVMQDANGDQGLGIGPIYVTTIARIVEPERDITRA